MKISKEVRLLDKKWNSEAGWPKRLEWIALKGVRGWTGQRIDFPFPIVAVCGENGSGKSTILQAAACAYRDPEKPKSGYFVPDFFPDTAWDTITDAEITFNIREGSDTLMYKMTKPTERWRGYKKRRQRRFEFLDLRRTQPVLARRGYKQLAKPTVLEASAEAFAAETTDTLSAIMGRRYEAARMAVTAKGTDRRVSVVTLQDQSISGFHQGAGELTVAELLAEMPIKPYSLLLIDEVETSLHPSSQRRLVRFLAELCRRFDIQVIMTTHSPFILEELPDRARGYIMQTGGDRSVIYGVSPKFALTLMDEESHPDCDLYVEDDRAEVLLREIIASDESGADLIKRSQFIKYGGAQAGKVLGELVKAGRLPRPSLVLPDGDEAELPGCVNLPGNDAPEIAVFEGLKRAKWKGLEQRLGRDYPAIVDACEKAMLASDHHDWVDDVARRLTFGGGHALWTAMCQDWAVTILSDAERTRIVDAVRETLALGRFTPAQPIPEVTLPVSEPEPPSETDTSVSPKPDSQGTLFDN